MEGAQEVLGQVLVQSSQHGHNEGALVFWTSSAWGDALGSFNRVGRFTYGAADKADLQSPLTQNVHLD